MARKRRTAPDGAPPIIPAGGELTRDQQIELAEHLLSALEPRDAARVFYAIEHWWFYGPASATAESQRQQKQRRERDAGIASLARELRKTLLEERGDLDVLTRGIDWPALEGALTRIAGRAARLALTGRRGRGAPPVKWRDDLIAIVHAHYPAGAAKLSWCGHFESTVALLLGYLGADVEDLHKQVMRTLARKPTAPLLVQIEEAVATEPRRHLPWSGGRT